MPTDPAAPSTDQPPTASPKAGSPKAGSPKADTSIGMTVTLRSTVERLDDDL